LLDYTERGAPRVSLANKVFSSTEYAKEEVIPMHHEMSYASVCPSKLFFCSEIVATEGGYTPLADDRKVIKQIPDEIKAIFSKKKVMYVRNYGLGIDMDWQEAFDTDDKAEVEAYLAKTNTDFEWISDDHLRTTAIRQVLATHPITGDTVWFNHAHLFHMSNMPEDIREFMIEEFGSGSLPRNAFYGDGSVIEDNVVAKIRDIYNANLVTFDWQVGDALVADNFLVSHGRSPFKGPRKVCVAMSELYTHPQ
jgi:alpha-ketoglutarate-dependent taurine dioxygenase